MFVLIQAILTFIYGDMASKSEEKRKRVVQFLNRVMTTRADWRKCTADHFMTEGVPKFTVYQIIKQYLARETFGIGVEPEHVVGSFDFES